MPDLTADLLPLLQRHRLPGFDLGDDLIYPYYADSAGFGRSIYNLPTSICRLLGVPPLGQAAPLPPELFAPLQGDPSAPQRLILILMDALALRRLQRWLDSTDPALAGWRRLTQDGILAPLTSITPSTTSAALTTLWSGLSPAAHGVVGYEMWLKEYGIVANTVLHSPMSFNQGIGSLEWAGFDPATALPAPTLGAHLAAHGVTPYALQHVSIVQSGLSRMFFKGVQSRSFYTATDLMINLRHLLEQTAGQRAYIWVYWGEVDGFSHRYGPDDERPRAEFAAFSHALQTLLLDRLPASARANTALILTADHGQVATRPDAHYELRNHPSLTRRLHLNPTGENRLAFLYIRPGQTEAVDEYIQHAWPNQFRLLDSAYLAEAGLFGPDERHPRLLERLGDRAALARGAAYLWWADKDNPLLGRHGGLHPDEMLVPYLAARL
jgi:hypothetical protein